MAPGTSMAKSKNQKNRTKSNQTQPAGLTDEQIARENEFLKGLPRFNIAAFLMPPIWGPANGMWITILWYPVWLFTDNIFYAAYELQTPFAITMAVIVGVLLTTGTVVFAIVSQPFAAHRAENQGISRETYLRRQRYWAIGCAILAALMLGLATYYNLTMRGTMFEELPVLEGM